MYIYTNLLMKFTIQKLEKNQWQNIDQLKSVDPLPILTVLVLFLLVLLLFIWLNLMMMKLNYSKKEKQMLLTVPHQIWNLHLDFAQFKNYWKQESMYPLEQVHYSFFFFFFFDVVIRFDSILILIFLINILFFR